MARGIERPAMSGKLRAGMQRRRLIHQTMLCAAIALLAIGVIEQFYPRQRAEGVVAMLVGLMVGWTALNALRAG